MRIRALADWDSGVGISSSRLDPNSAKVACTKLDGKSFKTKSISAFNVGVWSYGPDGKPNTGDDITTWPADVE